MIQGWKGRKFALEFSGRYSILLVTGSLCRMTSKSGPNVSLARSIGRVKLSQTNRRLRVIADKLVDID